MRCARPRCSAAALAGLLVSSTLTLAVVAAAPAGATVRTSDAQELATEACEEMVSTAVEAVIGHPLTTPPQGTWVRRDLYRCTYDVDGGTLVLRVDVAKNDAKAQAAFQAAQRKAPGRQRFNGLGQAAFQATDGTIVARKDRFLLTVDPSGLPTGLNRGDVAFAATVAVLACWTGET